MRIAIISIFFLFAGMPTFAQDKNALFCEAEDSLKIYGSQILKGTTDEIKHAANTQFIRLLKETLKNPNSFEYKFDSLLMIARLEPDDKAFRLFNWHLPLSNGTYQYYGIIQVLNTKTSQYSTYEFIDKTSEIAVPQTEKLTYEKWYGAHYYKVITTKDNGKKYYTLLGWKGNNLLTQMKVIDCLTIDSKWKPSFADGSFKAGKKPAKRIVFEYSTTVSMSLKYTDKGYIVYDHLAPKEDGLKGQYQYYGPDFSYDALTFEKGKWIKVEDFDAKNDKIKFSG
ncbi:MAG: hypothetical protein WCG93_17170, partial [Paludibacter sp.]